MKAQEMPCVTVEQVMRLREYAIEAERQREKLFEALSYSDDYTAWPAHVGKIVRAALAGCDHDESVQLIPPEGWVLVPAEATRKQESEAEDYWQKRRLSAFSDDPRTWAGVYKAMIESAPKCGES